MSPIRLLRVPVLLIGAFAALLVFSTAAAAETRTGESASPTTLGTPVSELTLVKASASYETGGSIRFDITTAAEPQTESEGQMAAELLSFTGECSLMGIYSNPGGLHSAVKIVTEYKEPTSAMAVVVSSQTGPSSPLPATKIISHTTTTLSFTSNAIVGEGYNCVQVVTADPNVGGTASALIFPISAPPPPPPPPPPSPPAPPAPTPAALSIGKLKPLKLKAEKWKTVRVEVTNTGGTATSMGSLRAQAPAKVLVKPEMQKLPALAPGASWKVAVRVRLPAKAKKTTLRLIGTAAGARATSSLVIRVTH